MGCTKRRGTATITIAVAAITLQDQATPSSLTGHSVQSRAGQDTPQMIGDSRGDELQDRCAYTRLALDLT